jgi:hypothetical protein
LGNRGLTLLLALALGLAAAAAASKPAPAGLLKLDLLRKPARRFTLKMDIFRGGADDGAARPTAGATEPAPAQAEVLQRSIAEEIAQSVSYEGFILMNDKPLALLNVSGEFFTVGEQESILDKIRLLKITREMVTIEYDGQPYEIRIKGDQP